MNFGKVGVLLKPHFNKIIQFYHVPLLCLSIGIILSTLPIKWNGKSVTFLQLPWGSSEEALLGILHEIFSWFWLFLAIPYTLRNLLLPLGDSTLVSQNLWLRLTPILPYEVALFRAFKVFLWGCWLGLLGLLWAGFTFSFHYIFYQVSLSTFYELFLNVIGLISYVVLAGGIVAFLDNLLAIDDYSGKRLIASFAAFIPLMLAPVYIVARNTDYATMFPYALPFFKAVASNKDSLYHFGSAFVVGTILLILHILTKLGALIVI